jgi:hypothetical protein
MGISRKPCGWLRSWIAALAARRHINYEIHLDKQVVRALSPANVSRGSDVVH